MPYITPPPSQDGEDYKLEQYYKHMDLEKAMQEEAIAVFENNGLTGDNGSDFLLDMYIEEKKEESCQ